jgi:hypothetical protein
LVVRSVEEARRSHEFISALRINSLQASNGLSRISKGSRAIISCS